MYCSSSVRLEEYQSELSNLKTNLNGKIYQEDLKDSPRSLIGHTPQAYFAISRVFFTLLFVSGVACGCTRSLICAGRGIMHLHNFRLRLGMAFVFHSTDSTICGPCGLKIRASFTSVLGWLIARRPCCIALLLGHCLIAVARGSHVCFICYWAEQNKISNACL